MSPGSHFYVCAVLLPLLYMYGLKRNIRTEFFRKTIRLQDAEISTPQANAFLVSRLIDWLIDWLIACLIDCITPTIHGNEIFQSLSHETRPQWNLTMKRGRDGDLELTAPKQHLIPISPRSWHLHWCCFPPTPWYPIPGWISAWWGLMVVMLRRLTKTKCRIRPPLVARAPMSCAPFWRRCRLRPRCCCSSSGVSRRAACHLALPLNFASVEKMLMTLESDCPRWKLPGRKKLERDENNRSINQSIDLLNNQSINQASKRFRNSKQAKQY